MRIVYVRAACKDAVLPDLSSLRSLKLGLVATAQHCHLLKQISKQLRHSKILGPITGCSSPSQKGLDGFLFVGTGSFHPKGLAALAQTWQLDPTTGSLSYFPKRTSTDLRFKKFLFARKIGIIACTKPGQSEIEIAERLAAHRGYLFLADCIQPRELQNWPIEFWIGTACPRLEDDIENYLHWTDLERWKRSQ